jgi:hypothetical protein
MRFPITLFLLALAPAITAQQAQWVHLSPDGKLVYAHSPLGDRIPDFSVAGYRGGGVALPVIPAIRTVSPSTADDTPAIQHAIDEVSALPLINGSRGAVQLAAGTFHCSGTLSITAAGVVLRGAGMEKGGTIITMTGDPHLAIRVAGSLNQKNTGTPTDITDNYVASGTNLIHLASVSGLHPGDTLLIIKPVTAAWLHFMGMDDLERNGKAEHWVGDHLEVRRRISSISGNAVTLAVPLLDSYDARFFTNGRATATKIEVTGQISEVGVESLRIVAPKRSITLGDPEFDGLDMQNAVDSWVQSVAMEETTNSLRILGGTERITVRLCDVIDALPIIGHAKPFEYSTNGSQILFDRCTGQGDSTFFFATQARQQGPVVILHCRFRGNGRIQPHQRWSTGLLVDNCEALGGGIDFINRGEMGTGHGWAIGWAVAWNNNVGSLNINDPPGVANWAIGNRGDDSSNRDKTHPAIFESPQRPVKPQSIYLEQLAERLGPAGLRNIGYE